ncbi:MAG: hypothetical protein L3K26_19050, partial [Candidatus Hydrogenedentes bacterium]|nr:hypothetical protein [Candidatus Hydrogenedentota bacterium]
MKNYRQRRRRNIVLLLITVGVVLAGDALFSLRMHRMPILSGWVLLLSIFGLALYNVRKKLPFLPLGSSAAWLQLHIYVGQVTLALFAVHVRWRIPNGLLEGVLAILYLLVFTSGVLGLFITRLFPRRMTARGGEVIYETIPAMRRQVHEKVEKLVSEGLQETNSTAVAEIYLEHLKTYFDRAQGFWSHLFHTRRRQQKLLQELQWKMRYLSDAEKQTLQQIIECVHSKESLDYHDAHQSTLKYWLFLHLPLTYALVAFAI